MITGMASADDHALRPTEFYLQSQAPSEFDIARPETQNDPVTFKTSTLSYQVNAPIAEVFRAYVKTNPLKIWSQPRAMVRAVFIPSIGRTIQRSELATNWPGFEEGMDLFLDMAKLPYPLVNEPAMMIALRAVKIDDVNYTITFAYLNGSPSYGFQKVEFNVPHNGRGGTLVQHHVWFRSYQKSIERLYPGYHRKMLWSAHRNYRKQIEPTFLEFLGINRKPSRRLP